VGLQQAVASTLRSGRWRQAARQQSSTSQRQRTSGMRKTLGVFARAIGQHTLDPRLYYKAQRIICIDTREWRGPPKPTNSPHPGNTPRPGGAPERSEGPEKPAGNEGLGAAARAEPRRSEARATQEHGRRDRVPSRGRTKKGPKATKHKRIMAIMYPPCGLEQTCACLPAWGGKMGRPPHAAAHRSPGRGSGVATAPRSSAGAPTCATAVGAPPPAFKTRPARSTRRWPRWRGGPPHPPFPSERSWGLRGADAVLTDEAHRSGQSTAEPRLAARKSP
jgi:hypothetical protein